MTDTIGVVMLAAGLGKRMGKNIPKPLIPLLGKSLMDYPLSAAKNFCSECGLDAQYGIVVGHKKELVQEHMSTHYKGEKVSFAHQKEQLGTADALKSYFADCQWARECEYTLVMCADTPLLTNVELSKLWSSLKEEKCDAIAATFVANNPFGYGRIIRGDAGFKIVEQKDASSKEQDINEVNSGLYIFKTSYILEKLFSIDSNNNANELYLTDAFCLTQNVKALCFNESLPFLGVNNPVQLNQAHMSLKRSICTSWQEKGVHIIEAQHCYIEESVELSAGTTIYPGVYLHGNTKIEKNCVIEPGVIIKDSHLSEDVTIKAYSYLEQAHVHSECAVGPYARLRPGTDLGSGSKIGNFVEVKKSKLEQKVSISHLSYVGDAEIGENVNIGCGFITCNYDGEAKHKTKIGKNSFIGSDTQTIAPVDIGENVFVGSGSTINQNIPNGSFALARAKQVTKENMAGRFLKGKWAIKKDDA